MAGSSERRRSLLRRGLSCNIMLRRNSSSGSRKGARRSSMPSSQDELDDWRRASSMTQKKGNDGWQQAEEVQDLLTHMVWSSGRLPQSQPAQISQHAPDLQPVTAPQTAMDALRWSRSKSAAAALRYPDFAMGVTSLPGDRSCSILISSEKTVSTQPSCSSEDDGTGTALPSPQSVSIPSLNDQILWSKQAESHLYD